MATHYTKQDEVNPAWRLIDCEGQTVGRLATQIAIILRGKDKPIFAPHYDTGDFIVAINAEKVKFTGNKWDQKMYYSHSGYMGGLKSINAADMMEKKPEEILRKAVKNMLPQNRLSDNLMTKLKIYVGDEHPHQAQKPEPVKLHVKAKHTQ